MTEQGQSLVERIADSSSCSVESVEQVLNDYNLNLSSVTRRHRSIRLDRLRLRGTKAGEVEPGTFDETFLFNLGVTVIAADNLRGKTSILEIVTLMLRGEPRRLQADVLSWLDHVALDVHINGQAVGFRLTLEDSEITLGQILSGAEPDLRSSDDVSAPGVSEIARAESSEEWGAQVADFMMNQMNLEEIQVFNRARNDDEAGTIKNHGWLSYFSVLYPASGADTVLLGTTAGDFMPVRLMQVFLDMPEATRSMRVRALAQRLDSEFAASQRRGRDANATIARQLTDAKKRLSDAEERLARLQNQTPAESLQDLAALATEAGERVAVARQRAESAAVAFAEAQGARIADEKALNSMRESKAASALFQGLNPQFCPRCETPIGEGRRSREHEEHHCAVCDTSLDANDETDYEEREEQAVNALAATRTAEKALDAARSQSQANLETEQALLDSIDKRIIAAESAHRATARIQAEQDLASSRAVVETLEAMSPEDLERPTSQLVLTAADTILREDISQAGESLYEELSDATRALGVEFGIGELEGIKIKANGQMDVWKGGGARSSFSAQSPGERLRLRYALVIALLRVARERGIAGHPGLLLLDSLKAEEVQDDHARILLQGLVAAAQQEPGLQILVTTADKSLAASVSGVAGTIAPEADRTSIF